MEEKENGIVLDYFENMQDREKFTEYFNNCLTLCAQKYPSYRAKVKHDFMQGLDEVQKTNQIIFEDFYRSDEFKN